MWQKYIVVEEIRGAEGCHPIEAGTYVFVDLTELGALTYPVITEDLARVNWVTQREFSNKLDSEDFKVHPQDLTINWNNLFNQKFKEDQGL